LLINRTLLLCPAVALAFDEQLMEGVPMDSHDRHVDLLATPRGLLVCSERARAHLAIH
jgi:5-formyltetrahydrofolate cyclo-ligase